MTRNVVLLGLVSLLTDTATEMIVPLLPAFVTTLGAGALALGWIEGVSDAVASVLKLLSGRWSDRLGRRRPLVVGGYALASTVRPLVALATAPWHVLAVRATDRVGKGLRTSPRDALIAASVPREHRGAAFGLHRAMDHTGAVLGPLIATAFLLHWPNRLRALFWLTAVPGALAVGVLVAGVREAKPQRPALPAAPRPEPPGPRPSARRLLVPLAVFTLGNSTDLFLLLKAGAAATSVVALPGLWLALHVVKALSSIPGGRLSDRWGRTQTIALGWLVYAAIYAGFALASTPASVGVLFILYGLYYGLTEGAQRALVSELVPAGQWGTGFGWYHLTMGVLTLVASVLFGWVWQAWGSAAAFGTGAGLALLAVFLLLVALPRTGAPRATGEAPSSGLT